MNRTTSLLQKFQQVLPRPSLITIYKAFIRPHIDYGDVIFDQALNNSFHQRLESIEYKSALAITGATGGPPRKSSIRNSASSPCTPVNGFEKYLFFTK